MIMKNKKAVSPVITTILLILIAIAAVGILAAYVLPGVDIEPQAECFKAIDQIEIDTASKQTCWYNEGGDIILNISVKRGSEPLGIERFIITVFGEGKSETFDLGDGENMANAAMINQPYNTPLEIPKRRELRTYRLKTSQFTTEITSAEIAPVVEGNIFCNAANRKNIESCQ
jgi:flagellin-like protein